MLADLLRLRGIKCEVLRGAMRVKERDAAMAALAETQALIATGKNIGEGFDLSWLDTLFLGLPISWKGLLAQYAGRIHRPSEGKDRVTIYDYLDSSLPTLERMFGRRAKASEALGYLVAGGEASAQFVRC
jgi:superfamily II DNA or RNA helicase